MKGLRQRTSVLCLPDFLEGETVVMVRFSLRMLVCFLVLVSIDRTAALGFSILLTVDSSQSSATIDIDAGGLVGSDSDTTSLSGTVVLEIDSFADPFGNAEITALNLTLDDAMSFSLAFGTVTASTNAGAITLSQQTSGGAVAVDEGMFSQPGNTVLASGMVMSSAGDASLADQGPQSIDYDNVSFGVVLGGINLEVPINFSIPVDLGVANAIVTVTGDVVAINTDFKIGDLDFDGDVDLVDFNDFFIPGWRTDTSGLSAENAWRSGDMDLNGITELRDFGLFRIAFNAANPGANLTLSGATVPEPSTIVIAMGGLFAFVVTRRWQWVMCR